MGGPSVSVIYDQITNLNKNKIRKLNFETKDIKNNFNFKNEIKIKILVFIIKKILDSILKILILV